MLPIPQGLEITLGSSIPVPVNYSADLDPILDTTKITNCLERQMKYTNLIVL